MHLSHAIVCLCSAIKPDNYDSRLLKVLPFDGSFFPARPSELDLRQFLSGAEHVLQSTGPLLPGCHKVGRVGA